MPVHASAHSALLLQRTPVPDPPWKVPFDELVQVAVRRAPAFTEHVELLLQERDVVARGAGAARRADTRRRRGAAEVQRAGRRALARLRARRAGGIHRAGARRVRAAGGLARTRVAGARRRGGPARGEGQHGQREASREPEDARPHGRVVPRGARAVAPLRPEGREAPGRRPSARAPRCRCRPWRSARRGSSPGAHVWSVPALTAARRPSATARRGHGRGGGAAPRRPAALVARPRTPGREQRVARGFRRGEDFRATSCSARVWARGRRAAARAAPRPRCLPWVGRRRVLLPPAARRRRPGG